jgi:dTDP-4-amino-4,6-dideoxygalactose transaminase
VIIQYIIHLIGHNSRLDEIQAAILRVKLKEIDNWNNKRRENAYYYNESLKDINLLTPYEDKDVKHVYHLYILQSEKRAELVSYLNEKGIATGVYYPVPLHLQKAYTDLGYKEGDMPNAEYLSHRTFAIPMFAELTDEEKQYIVDTIKGFGE